MCDGRRALQAAGTATICSMARSICFPTSSTADVDIIVMI